MSKIDLREYKKEIRAQMRKIRREMPPDVIREKNDQIFRRLVATQQYRRAKTVVLYVSKELEVDTRRLIKRAWKDGKRVAAPRCVENTRLMNMHLIRSMDDLQEGAFGILEPNENTTRATPSALSQPSATTFGATAWAMAGATMTAIFPAFRGQRSGSTSATVSARG